MGDNRTRDGSSDSAESERSSAASGEAPEVTPANPAVASGDPFAELGGIDKLRRLAHESNQPKPSRFRRMRQKREERRLRKRAKRQVVSDGGSSLPAEPADEGHTANWCEPVGVNVLLGADRICPACGRVV